jgi:hypothetical protein
MGHSNAHHSEIVILPADSQEGLGVLILSVGTRGSSFSKAIN